MGSKWRLNYNKKKIIYGVGGVWATTRLGAKSWKEREKYGEEDYQKERTIQPGRKNSSSVQRGYQHERPER